MESPIPTSVPPASRWRLIAAVAFAAWVGAVLAFSGFTFVYAKGASYLGTDAAACANCHVMRDHYDAWTRSSHHAVAACNDCHAPSDFFGKYFTKAENGLWHSLAFTTGDFPDPLRIRPRNRAVTEGQCRHCHADVVGSIDAHAGGERISCVRCHPSVGHMR